MAFFKAKRKKEEHSDMAFGTPSNDSLMDQVLMFRQQGYSDGQILQSLSAQGYNSTQISDAMNQASLSAGFSDPSPQNPDYVFDQQYSPQMQAPSFSQPYQEQQPPAINEERMQEIAEAIIDEKWEEFAKDIKKVIDWKEKSEERLAKVEQQIIDLRLSLDSLSKSIVGKISVYDQNIVDVGTEIKAMEKVFQKVLPTLTESVNKLDRMTKGYNSPNTTNK